MGGVVAKIVGLRFLAFVVAVLCDRERNRAIENGEMGNCRMEREEYSVYVIPNGLSHFHNYSMNYLRFLSITAHFLHARLNKSRGSALIAIPNAHAMPTTSPARSTTEP